MPQGFVCLDSRFSLGVCTIRGGSLLRPMVATNTDMATNRIKYRDSCSFPADVMPEELIIAERSLIEVAYRSTPRATRADNSSLCEDDYTTKVWICQRI